MSDRLTALDASFLHLEDASSHMHVAGGDDLRGRGRRRYDELARAHRAPALAGAALPPEAALRAARPGAAGVGRRPPLQPRVPRARHRAAAARQRAAAEEPRQPRVRAAARPHEAAVGDLARRGTGRGRRSRRERRRPSSTSRRRASRCCRRRTTRSSTASPASTSPRCCSTPRPSPRRRPRPGARGMPRPEPTSMQLLGDALIERAIQPAEIVRSARAAFRAPRRLVSQGIDSARGRRRARAHRARRSLHSAERRHRPAPPLRLGAHRPRRDQGRSRTSSAAPSTTSCWRS